MAIECLVLGAGQEVGKSCVMVTFGGGKRVMFDCLPPPAACSPAYPFLSLASLPTPSPRTLAGLPAQWLALSALLPAGWRPPPFSLSARACQPARELEEG